MRLPQKLRTLKQRVRPTRSPKTLSICFGEENAYKTRASRRGWSFKKRFSRKTLYVWHLSLDLHLLSFGMWHTVGQHFRISRKAGILTLWLSIRGVKEHGITPRRKARVLTHTERGPWSQPSRGSRCPLGGSEPLSEVGRSHIQAPSGSDNPGHT